MALIHRDDGIAPAFIRRHFEALLGRRTPPVLFAVALVPASLILVFIAVQPWVPVEQAFRDTYLATTNATPDHFPSLLGLASNLGILLWSGSGAVAFFAALVVAERRGFCERTVLLLAVALYSGLLCIDDMFMLHEQVYPRLLGVNEKGVFAVYGALLAATLIRFRHLLSELGLALLLAALGFFALSMLGDMATHLDRGVRRWAEDGPKFLGIALWATWTIRTSWLICTER